MLVFFVDLILLFFAYSFLGWCIEVTLKYFQLHQKFFSLILRLMASSFRFMDEYCPSQMAA